MNKAFKNYPYADAFGIKVKDECTTIAGRVLELQYWAIAKMEYCKNSMSTIGDGTGGKMAFVMGMTRPWNDAFQLGCL